MIWRTGIDRWLIHAKFHPHRCSVGLCRPAGEPHQKSTSE